MRAGAVIDYSGERRCIIYAVVFLYSSFCLVLPIRLSLRIILPIILRSAPRSISVVRSILLFPNWHRSSRRMGNSYFLRWAEITPRIWAKIIYRIVMYHIDCKTVRGQHRKILVCQSIRQAMMQSAGCPPTEEPCS